jgi:hypothetical protein
MKALKRCFVISVSLIVAGFAGPGHPVARAEMSNSSRSMSMVFDPETKKYFVGANSKFMLKQQDDNNLVDRIEVSIDGGDYHAYLGDIQFKTEGKHTLKFRAVSSVNNWSPVQFTEVFVDLTAPVSEATLTDLQFKDKDGKLFVSAKSTMVLTAQDNLSGISLLEYSWDNKTFIPYAKPIALETQGPQTIYYRSVDKVGNTEKTQKLEFTVDATPPQSNVKIVGMAKPTTIEGKSYLSVNDSVSFLLEAQDSLSPIKKIDVALDDQPWTEYNHPIFFLQEGPHTLRYYSEDVVGNKEAPRSIAIYTISMAPRSVASVMGKVVNTGGINFGTRDFQLKLDAKDNLAGLERIEYKVDNDAGFQTYLDPIRFKTPGVHTVVYRALDRAGNYEPTRTFSVNILDTAPETRIETAQPLVAKNGLTYSPSPNVVTLNVGTSAVGVQETLYSINNGPFEPYHGPVTLTADQKVYKLSYKSVDKLGNEERVKTVTYHMIGTIPIVDLFISNGDNNQQQQVNTNNFESGKSDSNYSNKNPRGIASTPQK